MAKLTDDQMTALASEIDAVIAKTLGTARGFFCFIVTTDKSGSDIQSVGNISMSDAAYISENFAETCATAIN